MTSGASRLRLLLLALVAVHVALGLHRLGLLDVELARFPSLLPAAGLSGAGISALGLAVLTAVSALWASLGRDDGDPFSARLGAFGLAHLALLGLAPYLAALLGGRLLAPLGPGLVVVSAVVATAIRRRRPDPGEVPPVARAVPGVSPRFGPWDVLTALVVLALLVPTVFPYVHFDAKEIWACRAFAFRQEGSLAGIASCLHPEYPPLYSILLWSGLDDPLFQGRLAPWLLLVFFLLLLRGRLARLLGPDAGAATAFVAATGHVVIGTGMYYANAALMAFLAGGALLVLDLPRVEGRPAGPGRLGLLAGCTCLAAASLVRPDGVVCAAVLFAVVVGVRWSRGWILPLWPFGVALAGALTWALRPSSLRIGHSPFVTPTGEWRTAGETVAGAVATVVKVFLRSLQGQWLGHWGLGLAVPLLVVLAAWWAVRNRLHPSETGETSAEAAFYLGVSLLGLATVAWIYLVVPFVGDPVAAVQPFEETGYLACYRNFVRVGAGRLAVPFLPFFVLFAGSALQNAREVARADG